MKRSVLLLVAVLAVLAPRSASAATILFDNFDSENGGVGQLNYSGFANFSVSAGTVDLIGFTGVGAPLFDVAPGNGLYVDLDGSTLDAGLMLADPLVLPAGIYSLSFDLAGNNRNATDETVLFALLGPGVFVLDSITMGGTDPFTTFSYPFTLLSGGAIFFAFQNEPVIGGDNIGALLDNVHLQTVPEPAMLLLLGMAALGLAARARRKRMPSN
jgi:hypothetical protein